jgi:DNA repair protein RecO (recombination protein O)
VLDLMSALHDGDWEFAEQTPQSHRSHVSGLVAAHLQWHLERKLTTLPLVERPSHLADVRTAPTGQDVGCG